MSQDCVVIATTGVTAIVGPAKPGDQCKCRYTIPGVNRVLTCGCPAIHGVVLRIASLGPLIEYKIPLCNKHALAASVMLSGQVEEAL